MFLPGLLGFNVIQGGLVVAAGALATYRTSGALRRVQVTGIAPVNLVLANATHALHQLLQGALGQSIKGDLLALAGWAVVLMAAASRAFRWDPA